MSDTLNATFAALLAEAYEEGAGLVKWGGDAVLLLFDGPDHAPRACRAAHRMRTRMREVGRLETSAGRVTLRMSVGIHSGLFHFFLVGDPAHHRELLVSGPAASRTADMEALAEAGQIAISSQTAALLDRRVVGRGGRGRLPAPLDAGRCPSWASSRPRRSTGWTSRSVVPARHPRAGAGAVRRRRAPHDRGGVRAVLRDRRPPRAVRAGRPSRRRSTWWCATCRTRRPRTA